VAYWRVVIKRCAVFGARCAELPDALEHRKPRTDHRISGSHPGFRNLLTTTGAAVKKGLLSATAILAVALNTQLASAQEREDRTLLDMNAIARDHQRGFRRARVAPHHGVCPVRRVRPIDEYKGISARAEAMVNFAKQYGYSTAEIEVLSHYQRPVPGDPGRAVDGPARGAETIRHLRCAHVPRGEPTGRRPHR